MPSAPHRAAALGARADCPRLALSEGVTLLAEPRSGRGPREPERTQPAPVRERLEQAAGNWAKAAYSRADPDWVT